MAEPADTPEPAGLQIHFTFPSRTIIVSETNALRQGVIDVRLVGMWAHSGAYTNT